MTSRRPSCSRRKQSYIVKRCSPHRCQMKEGGPSVLPPSAERRSSSEESVRVWLRVTASSSSSPIRASDGFMAFTSPGSTSSSRRSSLQVAPPSADSRMKIAASPKSPPPSGPAR